VVDVTQPVIGIDFLSYFNLLVDCCNNRLLDKVTTLSTTAQAASTLTPIAGGTPNGLLAKFPDFTRPARVQREVRHNTVHHIRTTPGPPITRRPRRLAPDRLVIAKAEFDTMLKDGSAQRSKSSWSSALHIMPKEDNRWCPC
jgi:cleavage and polyadenylation specificity factor subunit 1